MDDTLTITVRSERGVVIAAVTGEIDISTVAPLRERLFELADSGGTLIIDLKACVHGEQAGAEGHVVARAGSQAVAQIQALGGRPGCGLIAEDQPRRRLLR
jgi:hypothetical protein